MRTRRIKIKVTDSDLIPFYATSRSSGCDVRCTEEFTLAPGERKLVHTGIFLQLPEDVEVQVRPRSGLAWKKGVTVLNSPGTIDSDYQGECNVILINHSDVSVHFERHERIAQFVFIEGVVQAAFMRIEQFTENTDRSDNGFGSSGTK